MANAYIARGVDSQKVLAYVLRDSDTESLIAHTRKEGEPEEAEAVLAELKKVGVPPAIAFLIHGIPEDTLQEVAEPLWGERVELEHVGVVE
ncbi:hypothetical protein [Escherichia phage Lidtsur]|uniref:Uncharacterized protein n=1 Tax=Escherichia phage Lidtsur TaxID=2562235 RepID=A0A4D6DZ04_9CAUD|nr:hypothetical protein HOV34_gp04 [Escherichia phage Lidtsur]QBZ71508.1 hypothetical protein [Escherichia phage Lidtsur]